MTWPVNMKQLKEKGEGHIVNIGSMTADAISRFCIFEKTMLWV
jgi:hypothetical protein